MLNQDRLLAAHPMHAFALHAAEISHVAAAVGLRVGVDDLAIKSRTRNAEPIIVTHDWRRVHDKYNQLAFARFSRERDDAVVGVMEIDPLEAVIRVVLLPQRGLALVNLIQMLHQAAQPVVLREIEKAPIESGVVVPLVPLTELAAHE